MKQKTTRLTHAVKLNALMAFIKKELLPKRDVLYADAGKAMYLFLMNITPNRVMMAHDENPEFFSQMVLSEISLATRTFREGVTFQLDVKQNKELSCSEIFKDEVPFPQEIPVAMSLLCKHCWCTRGVEVENEETGVTQIEERNSCREAILNGYLNKKPEDVCRLLKDYSVEEKLEAVYSWLQEMQGFLIQSLFWIRTVNTVEEARLEWPEYAEYLKIPVKVHTLAFPFTEVNHSLQKLL